MGVQIGQGSLALGQHQQPSGPPFVPTSADNGLSVDPGTGHIVLGNDVGDITAALLSDRQIPLDGHDIIFSEGSTNKLLKVSGAANEGMAVNVDFDGAFFTYNSGQANAGTSSANFIQLYTESHAAILASTSTAHTAGFVPDAAILYGVANGGTAKLWILAENGIRFVPDGITAGEVAMSIFMATRNVRIANDEIDNGDKLQVDGNASLTGSLTTGDPGSGVAPWLLGDVVVAASVLDATQYLEVQVGGVVYKLALIQ